jgi:NodT family efflux transporter outer membrane factor (OMF) lipoprotein
MKPFQLRVALRLSAVVLFVVAVSGCSAARRPYVPPTPPTPQAWSRAAAVAGPIDPDRHGRWWESFGDPVLSKVLQQIATGSLDVKTAVSRVREGRAQVVIARGNRMPAVSAGLSATASHVSTEASGGIESDDDVQDSYTLGADASWELDVFGERRAGVDAAAATATAATLDLEDVLTSAMADGTVQYIRVRELQERVRLAEQNAGLQADTLDIARFRLQAGLTTELDVHQARTNLESTRAQIAGLQLEVAQSLHGLSLLQGGPPTALTAALSAASPIPSPPADVAIGVPAEALRRRPDVRAAERRIAAQAFQADATRARLYPRFSLVGSIGLETLDIARLFVPGASFFRFSPSASWNAFDRRQLKQNVLIADERTTQASLDYEAVVLRALREVEDALAAYAQEQVRRDRLTEAVTAAQQTADLATQRYNSGLRDFRDVLDAQRSLVSLQDQLASSRSNVSTAVVRLYRALGGGWRVPATRTSN